MRRSVFILWVVGALVGVAWAGLTTLRYIDRTRAQPVRDLSKMRSVRLVLTDALSEHYAQHGHYPASLTNLPLDSLKWGDEGSSVEDVTQWHYNADGQSFSMSWTNSRGMALSLEGKEGLIQ